MTVQNLKKNFHRSKPTRLLKILLIIDLLFIIGHIVSALLWYYELGEFSNFLVTQDGGYPEIFQYMKYLAIVLLVAMYIAENKKFDYLPWLVLFLFLFVDDAFLLHERSGRFFAETFGLKPIYGLRAADLGELAYAAIMGIITIGLLLWFYFKGSKVVKNTFIDISILFSILLFFAIVVDMVHQVFEENYIAYALIALVEDGGEMIALSFLVWYFYFIVSVPAGERKYLYNYLISKKEA